MTRLCHLSATLSLLLITGCPAEEAPVQTLPYDAQGDVAIASAQDSAGPTLPETGRDAGRGDVARLGSDSESERVAEDAALPGDSDSPEDSEAPREEDIEPPRRDAGEAADSSEVAGDAEDTEGEGEADAAAGQPTVISTTISGELITLTVESVDTLTRTYTLARESPQFDGAPATRVITESAGQPLLRSHSLLIDALFAMAIEEAAQNAVEVISDGAFGSVQPCECYTTGALWNWVWTRDIAYAVDLALAWVDPERARNSLAFKLSETKGGGARQIVQDTGSGGSWPVSTDRAVWARGASALMPFLEADDPFALLAQEAMAQTAEVDRAYVFDAQDGLYRGETSFLDWREQSYPTWTAQDTVHIAMSKALSTNLAHLSLLRAIDHPEAESLASAIDDAFWDGVRYRSVIGTTLDGSLVAQSDLLGTALAVLDLKSHPEVMATYPFAPGGPPVFHPQQPFTPIYHNRGTWPFVTAYAALAAKHAQNAYVFDAAFDALVAGAAKHLSHMENLEFISGDAFVDDGAYSGPVVNSRRQLWSVAGFLGAVVRGVFGMEASKEGVRFTPFVTHEAWDGATLHAFPFKGQSIDVTLSLQGGEAPQWVTEGPVTVATSLVTGGEMSALDTASWQNIYAPQEPSLSLQGTTLTFSGEAGTTFEVWADGSRIAEDATSPYAGEPGVCYAIRAVLSASQTTSQPTAPQCTWPQGSVQVVDAQDFSASGGNWSTQYGRPHYENWGASDDTLTMSITPNTSGPHLLQVVYGNGAGSVDTGITCAVKWMQITGPDAAIVGEGAVVMPQRGDWSLWGDSSLLSVTLEAGLTYEVTLSEGFNMSHLDHYVDYTGAGGGPAPSNYVNITQLKLLRP